MIIAHSPNPVAEANIKAQKIENITKISFIFLHVIQTVCVKQLISPKNNFSNIFSLSFNLNEVIGTKIRYLRIGI